MRVLTGIQPSGTLHWGNYFGAMKSMFDLQAKGEDMFMFIANFHAMTTVRDGATLRKATRDVALDYLACGLDPAKTTAATATRTRWRTASRRRTGSSRILC